jgi:hypothetical protein
MFNTKQSEDSPNNFPLKTIEMGLRQLIAEVYVPYNGAVTYKATATYNEHPQADYNSRGAQKEEIIEASSWAELSDKISEILGEAD